MVGKVKLGLFLSLAWWAVMNGQNLGSRNLPCPPFLWREIADSEGVGDRAVPVLPPWMGTAPTGQDGSFSLPCPPSVWQEAELSFDSLELMLLDIEIEKAKERLSETSFWKRIIPQIHISGSFGVRDVMFIDPATFTPYILPRDVYRLTISLSLNEAFNFSKHTQAMLELEGLSLQRSERLLRQAQLRDSHKQQLIALEDQLKMFQEELGIVQEMLRFNELRFEQGKIEFDTLMRTKLELLSVRKAIQRIHLQKIELELKLHEGDAQ